MPEPDLKSRLLDLDYPVLVDVARELEIKAPAGISKEDLVRLLVSTAPRRLESLARPAQLLEVEHQDRALQATLKGELAEQAADWEKKLSAKVERLGEKIETLQEAVGDVKNVFKFVTSGISILAAVATVLGAYNILDLWTTKEDFEQLQDQIQADAVELRSFTGGSRNILINKLLDETEDALRSFSSSLFELELQNRLRANHEVTTEVLSLYSDGHRPLNGGLLNGR